MAGFFLRGCSNRDILLLPNQPKKIRITLMEYLSQFRDFQDGVHRNGDVATLKGFEVVFSNIVVVSMGFAAIVLFFMLIIGGIQYITSGGNPQATQAASKTITYAIIGVALVSLALLILVFISRFTGVDVTNFSINQ